jgi:hypothetical protein
MDQPSIGCPCALRGGGVRIEDMKCLLCLSLVAAVLAGCGGRSELDLTRRESSLDGLDVSP